MTLLEWNLHKMLTSKTVEPYVCDEIIDANTDAICLVEYLHDDFIINCLREKYYIAETNNDGGNDILVAVNKTIVKNGIRIIKKTEVAGCYRFLHIAYNSQDDKEINLIGIRMCFR